MNVHELLVEFYACNYISEFATSGGSNESLYECVSLHASNCAEEYISFLISAVELFHNIATWYVPIYKVTFSDIAPIFPLLQKYLSFSPTPSEFPLILVLCEMYDVINTHKLEPNSSIIASMHQHLDSIDLHEAEPTLRAIIDLYATLTDEPLLPEFANKGVVWGRLSQFFNKHHAPPPPPPTFSDKEIQKAPNTLEVNLVDNLNVNEYETAVDDYPDLPLYNGCTLKLKECIPSFSAMCPAFLSSRFQFLAIFMQNHLSQPRLQIAINSEHQEDQAKSQPNWRHMMTESLQRIRDDVALPSTPKGSERSVQGKYFKEYILLPEVRQSSSPRKTRDNPRKSKKMELPSSPISEEQNASSFQPFSFDMSVATSNHFYSQLTQQQMEIDQLEKRRREDCIYKESNTAPNDEDDVGEESLSMENKKNVYTTSQCVSLSSQMKSGDKNELEEEDVEMESIEEEDDDDDYDDDDDESLTLTDEDDVDYETRSDSDLNKKMNDDPLDNPGLMKAPNQPSSGSSSYFSTLSLSEEATAEQNPDAENKKVSNQGEDNFSENTENYHSDDTEKEGEDISNKNSALSGKGLNIKDGDNHKLYYDVEREEGDDIPLSKRPRINDDQLERNEVKTPEVKLNWGLFKFLQSRLSTLAGESLISSTSHKILDELFNSMQQSLANKRQLYCNNPNSRNVGTLIDPLLVWSDEVDTTRKIFRNFLFKNQSLPFSSEARIEDRTNKEKDSLKQRIETIKQKILFPVPSSTEEHSKPLGGPLNTKEQDEENLRIDMVRKLMTGQISSGPNHEKAQPVPIIFDEETENILLQEVQNPHIPHPSASAQTTTAHTSSSHVNNHSHPGPLSLPPKKIKRPFQLSPHNFIPQPEVRQKQLESPTPPLLTRAPWTSLSSILQTATSLTSPPRSPQTSSTYDVKLGRRFRLWQQDHEDALRRGFKKFGAQWKLILETEPILMNRFVGSQLKDKAKNLGLGIIQETATEKISGSPDSSGNIGVSSSNSSSGPSRLWSRVMDEALIDLANTVGPGWERVGEGSVPEVLRGRRTQFKGRFTQLKELKKIRYENNGKLKLISPVKR